MTALPLKKWSIDERESILDYLYGDTPSDESKPCCHYEYARTSGIFQSARHEYDSAKADEPLHRIMESMVIEKFPLFWSDWQRLQILICPAFPDLSWRNLSQAQRQEIATYFVETRPPSLIPMIAQSFSLNNRGIFDRFKEQAIADECEWKKRAADEPERRRRSVQYPAVVGEGPIKYVALPIDYSQDKEAIVESFSVWLNTDANTKLLKRFNPKTPKAIDKHNPDSAVRYKELLKDLAAWRIHDELGLTEAKKWTRGNRRQYEGAEHGIRLRPFFGERPSERLNTKPLYIERRDWNDAIAKAKVFLKTEIDGEPVKPEVG